MTLDLTSPPLTVTLKKGSGELISIGPVTRVSWLNTTVPNEFGRMKPTVFLGFIEFKVGDYGIGNMQFQYPYASDYSGYSNLVVSKVGSETYEWADSCYPRMVESHS